MLKPHLKYYVLCTQKIIVSLIKYGFSKFTVVLLTINSNVHVLNKAMNSCKACVKEVLERIGINYGLANWHPFCDRTLRDMN